MTPPALLPEIFDALPPAVQAYIRYLEGRLAAVDGVEPTNNAAERALRHAVCWRKTSYGTDSAGGSRFVERVLTVVATCRQQGRDVLTFLTEVLPAAVDGARRPSLIRVGAPTP